MTTAIPKFINTTLCVRASPPESDRPVRYRPIPGLSPAVVAVPPSPPLPEDNGHAPIRRVKRQRASDQLSDISDAPFPEPKQKKRKNRNRRRKDNRKQSVAKASAEGKVSDLQVRHLVTRVRQLDNKVKRQFKEATATQSRAIDAANSVPNELFLTAQDKVRFLDEIESRQLARERRELAQKTAAIAARAQQAVVRAVHKDSTPAEAVPKPEAKQQMHRILFGGKTLF